MSLYNQLFGYNEAAAAVLSLLGVNVDEVPRFRDAWLDPEAQQLVIYTRTGGGNREAYAEANERLRQLSGFASDADDDFDSTYATFRYAFDAPGFWKEVIDTFPPAPVPAERWKRLFADMDAGKDTPDTRRSAEVQKGLAEQLGKLLEGGDKFGIIET